MNSTGQADRAIRLSAQRPATPAVKPARVQGFAGLLMEHWWIAFSLSSVCVVSGHLMIKAGLNAAPVHDTSILLHVFHLLLAPTIGIGLLIYLLGTACWMLAVSQKDISFLYPLSSVNYVLVVFASAFYLRESIPLRRAGGILLILAGMFLLNRRAGRQSE